MSAIQSQRRIAADSAVFSRPEASTQIDLIRGRFCSPPEAFRDGCPARLLQER
jgi:hypothetical protein